MSRPKCRGTRHACNQRRRLPDLRRSRGTGTRARAHAIEFARHHAADVGSPGCAVRAALPPGALRPARPRPIRRAQGPLYDAAPRPRRARRARRAQSQQDQLVRPFDGRNGRAMARCQCARAHRATRAHQHLQLFCGQGRMERPSQARARERHSGVRPSEHGALVHQGVPRAFARRRRVVAGDVRRDAAPHMAETCGKRSWP